MGHNALAAWKGDGIHNMEREDVEVTLSEIGNAVHTHAHQLDAEVDCVLLYAPR